MGMLRNVLIWCALCAVGFFVQAGSVSAQQANAATSQDAAPGYRDGQRDFDFEIGSWNIHLKRRLNPLTGSDKWVEFDGTSVTRKVWDGRSQIEEFETDGAAGHIEGLTLRLYNPQSHQWSLYWGTTKIGLALPQQVGHFDSNGVGRFYADDKWQGTQVIIRYKWWLKSGDHPRFEQAFSTDQGRTWETNWTCDYTRK